MRKPSFEKIAAAFIVTAALGLGAVGVLGSPAQGDNTLPEMRAQALAEQRAISSCMSAAGYSYIVALPNDVLIEEARQAAIAEGKEGAELEAAIRAATVNLPADPNEAAVAKLTAAKQAAWHLALMGTDSAGGGCDEPVVMSASALEALNSDLNADASAVAVAQADPLVVAAKEAYVSCMGSYGYTVADTEQINELIDDYNEAHAYPWPSDLPDVLPSTADAATKVRFAAANARTAAALAAIDSWTAQAEDAHEICAGWYDNEYERAYTDALNG